MKPSQAQIDKENLLKQKIRKQSLILWALTQYRGEQRRWLEELDLTMRGYHAPRPNPLAVQYQDTARLIAEIDRLIDEVQNGKE